MNIHIHIETAKDRKNAEMQAHYIKSTSINHYFKFMGNHIRDIQTLATPR